MFAHGDIDWPGVSKVNEEAGEIVQAIGKLMQTHGKRQHYDGSDLKIRLRDEMADAAAAIEFVMETSTAGYCMTEDDRAAFRVRYTDTLAMFRHFHLENR